MYRFAGFLRAHELYTSLCGYISCERLFRGLQLATLPLQEARQSWVAGIDCKSELVSGAGYQTEGTCLESLHGRPAGSECPEGKHTTRYHLFSGMLPQQPGGQMPDSPPFWQ